MTRRCGPLLVALLAGGCYAHEPLVDEIVGAWRQQMFDPDVVLDYTFGASGSFSLDGACLDGPCPAGLSFATVSGGSWSTEGDVLTLEFDVTDGPRQAHQVVASTFVVEDDVLFLSRILARRSEAGPGLDGRWVSREASTAVGVVYPVPGLPRQRAEYEATWTLDVASGEYSARWESLDRFAEDGREPDEDAVASVTHGQVRVDGDRVTLVQTEQDGVLLPESSWQPELLGRVVAGGRGLAFIGPLWHLTPGVPLEDIEALDPAAAVLHRL